jgi:hypothetical protein
VSRITTDSCFFSIISVNLKPSSKKFMSINKNGVRKSGAHVSLKMERSGAEEQGFGGWSPRIGMQDRSQCKPLHRRKSDLMKDSAAFVSFLVPPPTAGKRAQLLAS